jgi:hypothetical protein
MKRVGLARYRHKGYNSIPQPKKTKVMKKVLPIIAIAGLFTFSACTSTTDPKADTQAQLQAFKDSVRMAADTAGLAEYQQWKAQNELGEQPQYNDQTANYAAAAAPVRRTTKSSTARRSSSGSSNSGGTMNSESSNTAAKKKGWSKAAKGAAIGTAGGAVIGAVVNKKNRVVGGVVGGVIGGGVGYGIGRGMDKKDGRY